MENWRLRQSAIRMRNRRDDNGADDVWQLIICDDPGPLGSMELTVLGDLLE